MSRYGTPVLWTIAWVGVVLCWDGLCWAAENLVVVPTELKVSSVGVAVRAPLGFRYRAGEAFPLEIQVSNPGSAMDAEIEISEGDGREWAEQAVNAVAVTLSAGTSRVMLPMRAPGISAAVVLVIRGGVPGAAKAELFRSTLSRVLHPLASGGRVVVFCGGGGAAVWAQDQAVRLSPTELPAEGWMWESVDWVVLGDASIKTASADSLEALRRWLLGGGRLFLRSREAVVEALRLRLLPLDVTGDVPAELNWWEKHAGLTKEDVLATKNFRPVYVRMKNGLGQVVFLFPGSQVGDADEAAVFNRPELQRRRAALPDQRVQPDLFGAFVPAAASAVRRSSVMIWAALGGLIFCMGVFFARKSRSKIEALVLPLVALALMTALVANGFKQQDVMVSRVVMERCSADGAAVVPDEFVFLEAFRREVAVTARGPQNGTLAPRFDNADYLRKARLERSVLGGMMSLEKINVAPNRPAMVVANRLKNEQPSLEKRGDVTVDVLVEKLSFAVPEDMLKSMNSRLLIWVHTDGTVRLLTRDVISGGYVSASDSIHDLPIEAELGGEERVVKARANVLRWAAEDAVAQGGGWAIFWKDSMSIREPMIAISGASMTVGNEFWVRMVELKKGK